ncbi:unnamed protein product [Amoebophrya sp. A25]|nr:unnamed protein product [Amoebophrya sp. A25]|eukprot:GSA25T00015711001.1
MNEVVAACDTRKDEQRHTTASGIRKQTCSSSPRSSSSSSSSASSDSGSSRSPTQPFDKASPDSDLKACEGFQIYRNSLESASGERLVNTRYSQEMSNSYNFDEHYHTVDHHEGAGALDDIKKQSHCEQGSAQDSELEGDAGRDGSFNEDVDYDNEDQEHKVFDHHHNFEAETVKIPPHLRALLHDGQDTGKTFIATPSPGATTAKKREQQSPFLAQSPSPDLATLPRAPEDDFVLGNEEVFDPTDSYGQLSKLLRKTMSTRPSPTAHIAAGPPVTGTLPPQGANKSDTAQSANYVEVMYDPSLGVYYDPATWKYYKLKD